MSSKKPLCPLCEEAPKHRSRKCGFKPGGRFTGDNWSCETLIALRHRADIAFRDDFAAGSIAVLAIPDTDECEVQGYLVLTYYKARGTTAGAVILDADGKRYELTARRAQAILAGRQ